MYAGKFRDNFPFIHPAGLVLNPGDSVANSFKWYTIEDKVDALKHTVHIYNEKQLIPEKPITLKANIRTYGCNNPAYDLIRPPDLTSYQHLLQDLQESIYDSYWNKKVGSRRDASALVPKGVDLMNLPYCAVEKTPIKDIISPNKDFNTVENEAKTGHEIYIKSHNSYWAGEQINRNYVCPFTKNSTFGIKSNTDPHGILVGKCLKWSNQKHLCILDEKQAKFRKENVPEVGKGIQRNQTETNPNCKINEPATGVQDLLREQEPTIQYKNFLKYLTYIYKIRRIIKNQVPPVDFKKFYATLRDCDKDKNGWVPKELVYNICNLFKISFDCYQIEPLLEEMNIFKCDSYNIKSFVDIFNPKVKFPEIPQLDRIPKDIQYYQTIYQNSFDQKEVPEYDVSKLPPAGSMPPLTDGTHPDELGSESTVKTLLNPSLQSTYGLTHRDYLQYRSKDQLKSIFQKITNMSDEHFEFLWNQAIKIDNGQVNVQMLRDLLKKFEGI